ncbi:MAG: tRNA uridine-5-carboxymethylaminomethyl(34) synthesis enzyme MnmG [Planctomycetes bacterium]|nr:tRNA uridine-5-carboxymethylaminomethyl(34) synthesis enzyme MnmG [Planctomycetota bacterium]MBI3835070.1 tRNA uridine-5-carboxymethylaminomethyl(34) synthesis enzyme MnmG [Planctomycetota bacterium]
MKSGSEKFDVIIVGGGHAGIEAAWAAARMGAHVALITMQCEAIGRMSCNPAIGGLGKGQIVREIDALGGVMGLATDRAGIQFRMLNRSKGPAVWAPRAQCDRERYPQSVQAILSEAKNLEIIEGSVERLDVVEQIKPLRVSESENPNSNFQFPFEECDLSRSLIQDSASTISYAPTFRIRGVTLADGRTLRADAVILTTGTFLRGLMHCGCEQTQGGRIGETAAVGISANLAALGFELGRLKTGTPPRIHRDSIDYNQCELQPGDDVPIPFSSLTDAILQTQVPCWVTWTHEGVHRHIRENLHRAPMYSGQIQSQGPRYCPSIEDKVVRFADKDRHQIFLEPEGYDNERIYCNGISTSLPKEVQDSFVREVPGLVRSKILQHGYAVEYDYVPTHQTKVTLETKLVEGLFLAGQINGTSGYEEAGGQGLIAGVNAVQKLRGAEPFVLGRHEAYIGVMIDDLITRPPTEPYRMFTSRAEYRLLLRSDNAEERLSSIARRLGLLDDLRWSRFQARREAIETIEKLATRGSANGGAISTWLKRPDANLNEFADTLARLTNRTFNAEHVRQVMTNAKYSGYVDRQEKQIERFKKLESMKIPDRTNYAEMSELRFEARENLSKVAPKTLGQASRISGVSPADITVLWIYLTGRRCA